MPNSMKYIYVSACFYFQNDDELNGDSDNGYESSSPNIKAQNRKNLPEATTSHPVEEATT